MATLSVMLFPSCSYCSAVKATGSWYNSEGGTAKTTEKLNACGRCHIERYCNAECQRNHWSLHKVGCVATEKVIAPAEVDQIVERACAARPGRIILNLDSEKKYVSTEALAENMQEGKLSVDVRWEGRKIGCYTYLVCTSEGFDWKSRLEAILHPANGIHNPGAQVELGHEMIKKGLYREAFEMMAAHTPPHYKEVLQDMFFPAAVKRMHEQGKGSEEIAAYAALLKKNRAEVDAILHPHQTVALPHDLHSEIETAKQLPYGARDVKMADLAQQVVDLGFYDQAFRLVFDWVAHSAAKIIFFRSAVTKMIPERITHDKIVQLGKSINLTEAQILNETVGIYALHDRSFACQLAQQSPKPDYYLEIIFSALINAKRKEEARGILELVSPGKKRDLEFYLH